MNSPKHSIINKLKSHPLTSSLALALVLISILSLGLKNSFLSTTNALDNNFSNGITVDSTLDTPDDNIGDGICDDGAGNCTLRAAIQEANSDPDASTILFNISGTPDFTNHSQNGYTIAPQSALPNITEQVTINGYSQPGAQANTAPAPQPLNGTLLIELDGGGLPNANNGILHFQDDSDDSIIKGLALNDNADKGDGIQLLADRIKIQGNYIGTNPMGSAAESNTVGINTFNSNPDRATDVLVGGLNPEDRNLISGNTSTTRTTATASYPGPGWIIQGNYIGVGADGLTGIANSVIDGSGTLSIDNVPDVIVGGPQPTAINVIGSSLGHGIAPHNSDNLLIENNYIGLGYDGTTILGSGNTGIGTGITLSSSHNVTIKNNRVAGWDQGGMDINSDNSDLSIENNIIHDNEANGIEISASENIQVVGNTIYNNQDVSISVFGMSLFGIVTDDVSITGNKVGLDINGTPTPNNPVGINVFGDPTNVIIGGTSPADANHIASSTGSGITTMGFDVPAMSLSGSPQKVSILGNSIYDTSPASDPSTGAGLGIDLMVGIETDSIPDGIPNTYTSSGPTPNDPTDSDTGPNNYINFPVLNSVTQDGTNATINFNLDAADSPTNQYRIEFFANDQADPSGYGEGQTFLGYTTVSNGTNQLANLTLPSGLNLSNKSISATTTAIDNTTNSGFGSTSEFSPIVLASVTNPPTNPPTNSNQSTNTNTNLASTGSNTTALSLVAIVFLIGGGVVVVKRISGHSKIRN